MITLFLFLTLTLLLSVNRWDFAFQYIGFESLVKRKVSSLTNIFKTTMLHVWPAIGAILGKVGGAAASSGGGGMLGKMGGMMGGGGGGGGDTMGTLVNGATKPMKATMGLATGALQALQAAKLKKKADAAFPELVDPNQAAYLAELNQKRKSIETGADFSEGMRAADATNAATDDALVRNSGGDVGGAMQALLQSQRVANDAKNQIIGQGQAQQFDYDSAYGQKLSEISARKLQLQLARSSQLRSEWDRKSKLAGANLQAGMAGLVPGGNKTPQQAVQLGGVDSAVARPDLTGLSSVPSAPSATPVSAPTVTPTQPQNMSNGTPVNIAPQNLGPLTALLKK
jgi:hypothetical protein